MLKQVLQKYIDQPVQLVIYSSKTRKTREVNIVPSNTWGGQGLLGVSIRFCSFEKATESIWHVLEVHPNSPAAQAGLVPHTDYILGSEVMSGDDDLYAIIENNDHKQIKLFVYNSDTDRCREVLLTPNSEWGGEGSLGCGIGYGYLHRIPATKEETSAQPRDPELGGHTDVTDGPSQPPLAGEGYSDVPLSVPSQPSTPRQAEPVTTATESMATVEAGVSSMSITEQQPITNLPSSLTPAPVTVVRSSSPAYPPTSESARAPHFVPTYPAPGQNVMHQTLSQQQQDVGVGLPPQQQSYVSGLPPQPQDASVGLPPQQQGFVSGLPPQPHGVSAGLPSMPPPQSTQVSSLPGAPYTQPQATLPAAHSQSSANDQVMIGATPQVFTAGSGALSGLPAAPPTFTLPSAPPTISLGPTPTLNQSVSAQ